MELSNAPLNARDVERMMSALRAGGAPSPTPATATRAKAAAAVHDLGFEAPNELGTWFGAFGPTDRFLPHYGTYSLDHALDAYAFGRNQAHELAEEADPSNDPFPLGPQWMPIATTAWGTELVADMSGPCEHGATAALFDWTGDVEVRPVSASIGRLVRGWIACLEARAYEWEPSSRDWITHADRVAPGVDPLMLP